MSKLETANGYKKTNLKKKCLSKLDVLSQGLDETVNVTCFFMMLLKLALSLYITGAKETPEEFESDVMDLLKKHVRNDEKDSRFQQPDL